LFPKRTSNNLKGREGEAFFQYFVIKELGYIYHSVNQENDHGLDGYIEVVVDGNVTGKLIGVQIKHGDSYFSKKTLDGYKYIGDNKHLNYYLNNFLPVFIVIIDGNFDKMYWTLFQINKTMPFGDNNWWIEVSENNKLEVNFKQSIIDIVGDAIDYQDQIQIDWGITELVQSSDHVTVTITRAEIEQMNFDEILKFMEDRQRNKEMLINSRCTMDISFIEYSEDERELFEIPEIMNWLKNSIDIGIPWFYFLNTKWKNAALTLLVYAFCKSTKYVKTEEKIFVQLDNYEFGEFLESNLYIMNQFMERHELPIDVNFEITENIVDYYQMQMAQCK